MDTFPLIIYILAAKSILLCLGFMWAKRYQARRLERLAVQAAQAAQARREAEREKADGAGEASRAAGLKED
ncbi:unnamed protein product [Lampetra planeri]